MQLQNQHKLFALIGMEESVGQFEDNDWFLAVCYAARRTFVSKKPEAPCFTTYDGSVKGLQTAVRTLDACGKIGCFDQHMLRQLASPAVHSRLALHMCNMIVLTRLGRAELAIQRTDCSITGAAATMFVVIIDVVDVRARVAEAVVKRCWRRATPDPVGAKVLLCAFLTAGLIVWRRRV